MSAASQPIFIGTYTPKDGSSKGIYSLHLDSVTGKLGEATVAATTPAPTFLEMHPNGRVLYALAEVPAADSKIAGGVAAFSYEPKTGALTSLGVQSSGGGMTTHLVADATGKMLITVAYGGNQVTAFPLNSDGTVGPRTTVITHSGTPGPNTKRQDKPHPHSVTLSPDNRFAYVCDLTLDKIFCYALNTATATLTPAGEFAALPGAGPRHSKISNDGKFFYAINELGNTLAVYSRDLTSGALTPLQSETSLPADFAAESITAEVRIHPNGKFVYASNRGHDSIAVFSRNPDSGLVALIEVVPCGGKHPRNFNLSPDAKWLVCANRDTNNLTVFKIDAITGKLTDTKQSVTVPQPVCVLFAP
ncbi:lactonase family protein [Oleiharenicola lentus]|uniref:lactonase family protein n=1 Tax=Oleiharenicola lentus TaxID=2508720 RepID=UPI003F67FF41